MITSDKLLGITIDNIVQYLPDLWLSVQLWIRPGVSFCYFNHIKKISINTTLLNKPSLFYFLITICFQFPDIGMVTSKRGDWWPFHHIGFVKPNFLWMTA